MKQVILLTLLTFFISANAPVLRPPMTQTTPFVYEPPAYNKSVNDLIRFLQYDDTDQNIYTEEQNCVWFSELLIERLRAAGFVTMPVVVEFQTVPPHEFVIVPTVEGWTWIEPINDELYEIRDNRLCYVNGGLCWQENVTRKYILLLNGWRKYSVPYD